MPFFYHTWLWMDEYSIPVYGSSQISTIRQNTTPTGLHVLHQIKQAVTTVSTLVRQSANAACQLCDLCWADSLGTAEQ